MTEDRAGRPWWGSHEVPTRGRLELTLGALTLWVTRLEREWRIGAVRDPDTLRAGVAVRVYGEGDPGAQADDSQWDRFAQGETSGRITLTPGLMDRAFVVRPYAKLHLLPNQQVVVYVTTPLVVRLSDDMDSVPMVEVPVTRPSETWHGANTIEGTVCYAGRTHARLQAELLERRESRATTAIRLHNQGSQPYWVEKLYVPVPRLALWEDIATGALHTDSLTLTRERGDEEIEVHEGPPWPGAQLVARARESEQGVSVLAMLNQFWGGGL